MADQPPTYLVCSPISYFADDVAARCSNCDAAIVHRPHVDHSHVKICGTCAAQLFAGEPEVEVRITEETVRELTLYYATPKGRG